MKPFINQSEGLRPSDSPTLLLNGGDPCTPPSSLRCARSSQLAPLRSRPRARNSRSALARRSRSAAEAARVGSLARSFAGLAIGFETTSRHVMGAQGLRGDEAPRYRD